MSAQTIPPSVAKYFWGDNLKDLDIHNHKSYIIQTLLEKGNKESLRWLFATFDKKSVKHLLPTLKLSKKSANFWDIYFS